jgi:hypothetical protein
VAQVVYCLPRQFKAMNLNTSTTKDKRKKMNTMTFNMDKSVRRKSRKMNMRVTEEFAKRSKETQVHFLWAGG